MNFNLKLSAMELIRKTEGVILAPNFAHIDCVECVCDGDSHRNVADSNHRDSYANSPSGRERLQKEQPENIVEAVLAFWGKNTTVEDPELPEVLPEPAEKK